MDVIVVVNDPSDWPLKIPGVEVISDRKYLFDPHYKKLRRAKVFNLSRSYRYQTSGYYVSLLAGARGHKPMPAIQTIQDMRSPVILRIRSEEFDRLVQKSLARLKSKKFTLSIYFGKNLAKRYDDLCAHLFKLFPVPFIRVQFTRDSQRWALQSINPINASDIPPSHLPFVLKSAKEHLASRYRPAPRYPPSRFDLAILHNAEEAMPPSDAGALNLFMEAAEHLKIRPELIGKDDYGRIAEFDALFIRETTSVNHHTYRFARRGSAEGLVVIDDSESILKCTNKVYLAELLTHHHIPTPKTVVLNAHKTDVRGSSVGWPCILKQPDSSFSQGVIKVDSVASLRRELKNLGETSELVIAQEYIPTEFDWRIGIFDRKVIFACKYHMAKNHWQIIHNGKGKSSFGRVQAIALNAVPPAVVRLALAAANLIGDGFYGVDIKASHGKLYVIEVNDNPNVDAGCEDGFLKHELYLKIMKAFYHRIERRKEGAA